ncbi:MAG TPA: hypothetical protein VEB42_05280 [Chitinophagaceae bacterium]|nr:hypothetical protein [Chitinophagaceae bacterium]
MLQEKEIKEQIKELLVLHNGNLKINDHPELIADAQAQGIDLGKLNKWAIEIYQSINWSIFEKIDEKLVELLNLNDGIFKEQDAQVIIELVKGQVGEQQVISYLVQKLAMLGLQPRDRIPLEWSSFVNPWMTDIAWARLHEIVVNWLDEKASTLEKMGEISYRKKEETMQVLRRTYKLPSLVTVITRSSSGDEDYVKIIEEETDIEKRYLRVLYHLNPSLPFRFKEHEYKTIDALLTAACSSPDSFWQLEKVYESGHIHIWVKESSPDNAHKLTDNKDLNGFLTFLYSMDPTYPFFIMEYRFDTAAQLVEEIKRNKSLWQHVAGMISQGSIKVWFAGSGKEIWNDNIEKGLAEVKASAIYRDEEFGKASVQVLINSVTLEEPVIESSVPAITLVDIEAALPIYELIDLKFVEGEFVKAAVTMSFPVPGLSVTPGDIAFEQPEHLSHQLSVRIDPAQLTKNKDYQPIIIVETLYQRIEIPLFIRVVYPMKAVLLELGKYAFICSSLCWLARFLIGEAIGAYSTLIGIGVFTGMIFGSWESIKKYKVEKGILALSVSSAVIFLLILLIK